MANEEQLAILRQGVKVWNKWRMEYPNEVIDLTEANLDGINLDEYDLNRANFTYSHLRRATFKKAKLKSAYLDGSYLDNADFSKADMRWADLQGAMMNGANLRGAYLIEAYLGMAYLEKACLDGANLNGADLGTVHFEGASLQKAEMIEVDLRNSHLKGANLSEAILKGANLSHASLIEANLKNANLYMAHLNYADLTGADLTNASLINTSFLKTKVSKAKISNSKVYGVNVWDLEGEFEEQKELIITQLDESVITVDNIEVAQFIYLVLNNKKFRDVINTLTSKTVLILGRFAIPERKEILDALRNQLRKHDLLPVVFDFDRPTDKDFTETIKTLAGISYFVIADVTNPKSSPLELQATVPDYQIPFVPIIQEGESPFAMMVDLQKKYPWVLPTRSYDSIETLMAALKPGIIDPAVEMRNKLRLVKAQEQVTESLRDYVDKTL